MSSDPALTLYGNTGRASPWVLHAMVALEEKALPYRLELVDLPLTGELRGRARGATVPILVHGEAWLTESLAISEYLAERFPWPDHPRLFPADLVQRAHARQVMSVIRTTMFALREARPTSTFFGPRIPATAPLGDAARADAEALLELAAARIAPGAHAMFDAWCIADTDLAVALMRLVANGDPVPAHLADYARVQLARPSVARFMVA